MSVTSSLLVLYGGSATALPEVRRARLGRQPQPALLLSLHPGTLPRVLMQMMKRREMATFTESERWDLH